MELKVALQAWLRAWRNKIPYDAAAQLEKLLESFQEQRAVVEEDD